MNPAELVQGQVLRGKYIIDKKLGEGGMGAAYLAREEMTNGLERKVIIKQMLPYYESDQEARLAFERFREEAGILANLAVPGIPRVYDYFDEGAEFYMVIEYIEGPSLDKVPPRDRKVIEWGIKLCDRLEDLERCGVMHLDIKPENVVLAEKTDDPWLIDFGIAQIKRGIQVGLQTRFDDPEKRGTRGYAPLEQESGNPGFRSDVYALSATLYCLMTDDDPRNHPGHFPCMVTLDAQVQQVLRSALEPDVTRRVDATQLREALTRLAAKAPVPVATSFDFRWKDGTNSRAPADMAVAAADRWSEALEYFRDGAWENFFRALNRNDILDAIQKAKDAHRASFNQALDAFIRSLYPALPNPVLEITPSAINLGTVELKPALESRANLELTNRGNGCLSVSVKNNLSWLVISPHYVELLAGETGTLHMGFVAKNAAPGPLDGSITLVSNGGAAKIPCHVQVCGPSEPLDPEQVWNMAGFRGGIWSVLWGIGLGAFTNIVAHLTILWIILSALKSLDWLQSSLLGLITWSAVLGAIVGAIAVNSSSGSKFSLGEDWSQYCSVGPAMGILSGLLIGIAFIVAKSGWLTLLVIVGLHFVAVGFLVSIPVGLAGAVVGLFWCVLMLLVRGLMLIAVQWANQ